MAPPTRATEFKVETYERLTALSKARLKTIQTAVDRLCSNTDPLTPIDIQTLNNYEAELEKKKADFESNFQRVLLISGDDAASIETLSEDQDHINDTYVYILSRIRALLPPENSNSVVDNVTPSISQSSTSMQVRLPKLDLKTFSGDLTTWTSFINLFDASIHQNSNISNVMKFQYLLSVVHGEPLNLIKSLSLTDDNYIIAYQLLRDHYHNDRRLKSLHLNRLLDLPSISLTNTRGVRQFINEFTENSQALAALNCSVGDTNPVLAATLLRKMDVQLRKRFEGFRSKDDSNNQSFPEVKEIIKFLSLECTRNEDATLIQGTRSQDTTRTNVSNKHWSNTMAGTNKRSINALATNNLDNSNIRDIPNNSNSPSCFVCSSNSHRVYNCSLFKSKSPQERYRLVKQHRHCDSCLGKHALQTCQSLGTCSTCQKRHNTLLHFNSNFDNIKPNSDKISKDDKTATVSDLSSNLDTSVTLMSHNQLSTSNYTVLLGTLLIRLRSSNGTSHVFRALLDSGSMCDLISERAVSLLNSKRQKSNIQLTGIDQCVTRNKGQVSASIETLSGNLISPHHSLVILDKLTVDLPRMQLSADLVKRAQSFSLADPQFHVPGSVDVVLGGSLFPQLLTHEQYSLGQNMPYVLGTQCGYVVMGNAPCLTPLNKNDNSVSSTTAVCFHAVNDTDLHASLQRFWVQEDPPLASKKTAEEDMCDRHFSETHTRNDKGRYILRLPIKECHPPLGNSRAAAETRLTTMERRFSRNERFSELYHAFMQEYIDLGHMSKHDSIDINKPHYFLPHHGILKESSSTTKLRTVFDASCSTSLGTSLNDILMTGQKLQTNICDILMNFRSFNTVFCCDIKQMYRQILVHPDDRDLQLILWRNHPSDPISTFQLNTVTYGVNCSPFLAIKTLHQLAEDEGDKFPEAAHALKNHTYVDDIIVGANTVEEALKLKTQLISLLQRGGFELRKWISNSPQLLEGLPENYLETPKFLQDSQSPQFSVLGLNWSPATDAFTYKMQFPFFTTVTKRLVLSTTAKLYDPCGFLAPFILLMKCFMQLMWTKGCNWDEPLPLDLTNKWKIITDDTRSLKDICIPRSLCFPTSGNVQLHGFCDASERGYAAVVYFRNESPAEGVTVRLLLAKSKVAPLKRVTLPRLELCAAHLLAKLIEHCCKIFSDRVKYNDVHLWCDSTIVLTWLQTPSYQLKTYVANRVAQAQELVPSNCWKHISSTDNPADCASRGLIMSHLKEHPLWWTGPSWLNSPPSDWPQHDFTPLQLDTSTEIKSTPLPVLVIQPVNEWSLLSRFSSWTKLLQVMSIVLRFIHNCRTSASDRRSGFITTEELRVAKCKIFWCVQQTACKEDLDLLSRQKECSKRLLRLSPFIDEHGLIRVGGRLNRSSLSYDAKHPILLPKNHHITHILIDYYHVTYLHAGPQLVQSLLTQFVWILNARSIIRSRIFKCLHCFKHRPKNQEPLMGDLPISRITPAKPFLSTGIDYGGPFTIKMLNFRYVRYTKVFICLFICMVTKAVHIEVAENLSTDAFLGCLTRFVSRRGKCSDIYSDCGTNFVGAYSELKRIVNITVSNNKSKDRIYQFANSQEIRFHFNPPNAPHHGGLWESAIKSAKHHLHRVIGKTVLTYPEFTTLTVRIEAMLNSRPLTPISNDPSDLKALTPGHFLVGGPMVSIPEVNLTSTPSNHLKHWQLVQQFNQHIWRRWSAEYLHTLHQRSKWTSPRENIKVGDMVLVQMQSPPCEWPLARVLKVNPGADGIVRVAQVKTINGTFTRPVVKLYPLPNTSS